MLKNYQILIEYEGTNFVGWQIQKNGLTVQEVIQKALKKITKKKIILFGSGRTDTGVHAIEQSAHFKTSYQIKNKLNFIKSLNFFLYKYNVSILDIKTKTNKFHARFDAKKRTYKYIIINRPSELALNKNRAWNVRKKLNTDLMSKGCKILEGTRDFSTFRASSCSAKSPFKTLKEVKLKKLNNRIQITFVSQSFLQQQIRSMVGCLKYLGEGKWSLKYFKKAMLSRNRSMCAPVARPEGLYLYKVNY